MLNFDIWKEERELHKLNSSPYKYRNTRMKCCFHFVLFCLILPCLFLHIAPRAVNTIIFFSFIYLQVSSF